MIVIDAMKETVVLVSVMLFAVAVASLLNAWNNLPEYVWHLNR